MKSISLSPGATGGRNDQALDIPAPGVHLCQQGQAKGHCLPGAGLGLGDEVAAVLQQEWVTLF